MVSKRSVVKSKNFKKLKKKKNLKNKKSRNLNYKIKNFSNFKTIFRNGWRKKMLKIKKVQIKKKILNKLKMQKLIKV